MEEIEIKYLSGFENVSLHLKIGEKMCEAFKIGDKGRNNRGKKRTLKELFDFMLGSGIISVSNGSLYLDRLRSSKRFIYPTDLENDLIQYKGFLDKRKEEAMGTRGRSGPKYTREARREFYVEKRTR